MKTAIIFPGQGSQFTGMGKDHYDNSPVFKNLVDQADELLGFKLSDIMFNGPDEALKQTENTQPAIFLHSTALFALLKESENLTPDMVAGHSLGEFSALVACGAVEFKDAIRIVRKRGQLMQHAGTENPGTMAAIIGADDNLVEEACKAVSKGDSDLVVAANYNCPGQLVISGHEPAIDRAIEWLKENGAKIAKKLPVSGAFHSPLMQPALDGLRQELESLNISAPDCPIYSNYTAKATSDPEVIRENLLKQLLNPVKWTQTLNQMIEDGAEQFIEVGPGKVLQGLVKRTNREAETKGYQ